MRTRFIVLVILLATWAFVVPIGVWLSYLEQYGGCDAPAAACHGTAMGYVTALAFLAVPWGLVLVVLIISTMVAGWRLRHGSEAASKPGT